MAGGWPGAGVWILPRHKAAMQICKRDAPELRPASILRIGIVDRLGRDNRLKQVNEPSAEACAQANRIRYFELNASATRNLAHKQIASRFRSKKCRSSQTNRNVPRTREGDSSVAI